jgi:hypothetical protein
MNAAGFDPPPATAAWLHREARRGFEVVHFGDTEDGYRIEGRTAAVESGHTCVVDYEIGLNRQWVTRVPAIISRTALGIRSTVLEADGHGQWKVDGEAAPQLDGCLDVGLEASAFTNALPVHRLQLAVGDRARAPAAYVRALDVTVEGLEQTYVHTTTTVPDCTSSTPHPSSVSSAS